MKFIKLTNYKTNKPALFPIDIIKAVMPVKENKKGYSTVFLAYSDNASYSSPLEGIEFPVCETIDEIWEMLK